MRIENNRYGKQRVRLTHLDRTRTPHRLVICAVSVSLEGDFAASYTDGDNRKVVATDSIKNTVYVLARERGVASIDSFARSLARHFVDSYDTVTRAAVGIRQEPWIPIEVGGAPVSSALTRRGPEEHFTEVVADSAATRQTSGIDLLPVIKTAQSSFSDFYRDRFATLKDTEDRLFATTIRAEWEIDGDDGEEGDEDETGAGGVEGTPRSERRRETIRTTLMEAFAAHRSLAVQETLYSMAAAVLDAVAEVRWINLVLPNQHHLLADLSPFDLDNPNQVFVGTDEPFGQIEATVSR